MKLKYGSRVDKLTPAMWFASGVVAAMYARRNFSAVLTSGDDSHETRPKSLHHKGEAADYRIRYIPASSLAFIVSDIKDVLEPAGYDVKPEKDHLHVEYDPKNGEKWLERVE